MVPEYTFTPKQATLSYHAVQNIFLQERHCGKIDNSNYLHRVAAVASSLTSEDQGDHSRWEVITLLPVGHLVGLPDRLAGGTHSDRMFY